jgi:hypothetical protein
MTATFKTMTARRGANRLLLAAAAVAGMSLGISAQAQRNPLADDPTINGFAVEDAADPGTDVHLKIETDAKAFSISIYRFMNGDGNDELVASLAEPAAPQVQPPCLTDSTTGAMDCSNWSQSAAWSVASDARPGTYYALLRRADTGGVNHILFVVSAAR